MIRPRNANKGITIERKEDLFVYTVAEASVDKKIH